MNAALCCCRFAAIISPFLDQAKQPGWWNSFRRPLYFHQNLSPSLPHTDAAVASFRGVIVPSVILLVDDHTLFLRLLEQLLTNAGLAVRTADNGAAALALYQRHQGEIGLVLTDVIMPGMDGVQLVRSLKAIDPGVRFCFLTAHSTDGLSADGPLRVFEKHSDLGAMIAELGRLLANP